MSVKSSFHRPLPALLVAALPLALGACVMPDDLSRIQKDVADVRQQLRHVQEIQSELERRMEELPLAEAEGGDEISREEIAEMRLRLEQQTRQMSITAERMNDLEQRLDGYSQQAARGDLPSRAGGMPSVPLQGVPLHPGSTAAATEPSAAPGSEAVPDPEALYNTAYADFSKGNYALAISGFREYQQRFSQSPLADNALYWIAECYFSQADFTAAIDALDDLLGRYPESDKAPAANLKKALSFQEQNQIQRAIIQYRYVVSEFPTTDEARLARDKLEGLGTSPD